MADVESTCWTLIRDAAAGTAKERTAFALRYEPAVRAYLGARWKGTPMRDAVDDTTQDVFVECFQGALARADPTRGPGFRPYLYGLVRNVARRREERRRRRREMPMAVPPERTDRDPDEHSLSRAFDRAWARAVVQEAGRLQSGRAARAGPEAMRRVDLLRLRFVERQPIREIARRWDTSATHLHREYAKARTEFKRALLEVMAFDRPGTPGGIEQEGAYLLSLLKK